ncbi:MAG: DNA topoisomerase, partial [Cyanobacteria bacterium J06576_12]
AIRPTEVTATPAQLRDSLSGDAAKLYELIWNRALASQCCPARLRKTRIVTQAGETYWEARGQLVEFAGYTRYWNNISADSQLPVLQQNQAVMLKQAQAEQKQTQSSPRYSEPKLVQLMERKGIGRPSTYAPTIKTLRSRTYVHLLKGKLQPTPLGLALDSALEMLLPDLIQPTFTAKMEADLDAIASGKQNWEKYLTTWHKDYFGPAIAKAKTKLCDEQMKALRAGSTFAAASASSAAFNNTGSANIGSASSSRGRRQPKKNTVKATPGNSFSGAAIKRKRSGKTPTKSKVACPKCQQPLSKIPSKSKKLKANHFLKCEAPTCGTVMFWNSAKKGYELPYAQRAVDPKAFTDHPCPSCGALLIRHHYQKEGKDKVMLRCSILDNRKGKCKDVAFFQSRDGGFWSPKFGELTSMGKSASRQADMSPLS